MTLRANTAKQALSGLCADLNAFAWEGILQGDTCDSLDFGHYADRSVQVTGTFGAAGAIALNGSIDGTNWAILHDPFGNALNITSAGIYQITELVLLIQPVLSGGDGTTDLNVYSLNRRT